MILYELGSLSLMSKPRKQYPYRKIKYLAVSGGGWRTLYAKGVIDKLNELHILENIEAVAVTSGGCMTGFILAFGYNSDETMQFLEKHVLNGKFSIPLYFFPEHVNSEASPYYTIHEHDRLFKQLGKSIINTAIYSSLFFKNMVDAIRSRGIFHTAGLGDVLWKVIQESPTFPSELKNRNLTFLEHHQYREQFEKDYPNLPFVDLYIIVTECMPNGFKQICCSYETTPHKRILEAACASMAIPFLFRRVGNLMDGAVTNNTPGNTFDAPAYFEPDDHITEMNMRTLAIRFAASEDVIANCRDNKAIKKSLSIPRMLAIKLFGLQEYQKAQEAQEIEQKRGANPLRTIYINCKKGIPRLGPKTLTTKAYKEICENVGIETRKYVDCYLNTPDPHAYNYGRYFKIDREEYKDKRDFKRHHLEIQRNRVNSAKRP